MSRPIKISDGLYERLKDRAEELGMTLQDSLIELITEPHEGLAKLESELRRQNANSSAASKARDAVVRKLEELSSAVARLRKRVDQLYEVRGRDNETWNCWVEIWNRIRPLESRVAALEKLSHQHFWQDTDG